MNLQNPMLKLLSQNQNPTMSNPLELLNNLKSFAQTMKGKNPEQMVNELRSSGKISDEQFNQLSQQANEILKFLK